MTEFPAFSRRHIIQGLTLAASFAFAGPAVAARLITTPHQTTGPFYPESLPLDSDNDLVQVQGRTERAQGEVAHIFGRILDQEDARSTGPGWKSGSATPWAIITIRGTGAAPFPTFRASATRSRAKTAPIGFAP